MNNNDERDYAEERYNAHLLDDETDSYSESEDVTKNLASLNEIVAELVTAISDDPDFIELTRGVLREHSWKLGFSFQGEQPSREFYGAHPEHY